MRLDQVFKRMGVEIVKADKAPDKVVLLLRVKNDRLAQSRWKVTVEEFLLARAGRKNAEWQVDLSKSFFVTAEGAVKYLWRVILTGKVRTAADFLGQAALRSISMGAEVKSMPLVGQVNYEFDPANGKMKGGHPVGTGARAAAFGMSGGNVQ